MSSQVVKQLQKLHVEERSGGLEDLVSLGPTKRADDGPKTPVRQKQLECPGLTESMILRKEKVKVAENEKYYYRSPCPEKENLKNFAKSPSRGGSALLKSSLVDSVAQFVTKSDIAGEGNCKVFVGNISYRVKDRELRECFEMFGNVKRANVCKDKRTKKSRGFGFVVFSNREDAEKAIYAPDHLLTYDGRLLKVTWAERKRKGKTKEKSQAPSTITLEVLARSYLEKEDFGDSSSLEDSEEDGPEESFIDQLNDDILLRIFSFLELKEKIKVERVCKRWYNISRQSWKSLTSLSFKGMFTAFQGTGGLTDKILVSILKRGCYNLQKLDLSGSPYLLSPDSLFCICKICTEMKCLNLSNVAVNNHNLKEIGSKCTEIETLILGRCKDFGEKGLWWFLKEAKNLKHLEVTDNVRVTGKSLWMLSDTCQVLNLNSCVKISDVALENISKRAPNLLDLNISNCLLVSDVGLTNICTNNKKLQKLVFSEARNAVTVNGLLAIGQLTELEYLTLSQNQSLDDDVIMSLVSNCKKLRFLNVEACHGAVTDVGIKSLSNLEHLEELNISYLTEITDESLQHLAANTGLRALTCRACTKLTNEGLLSLLFIGGSSLVSIDLSGCYSIDDRILNDAQLTERDENLQQLKINVGGTSMTLEGAKALEEKIKNCHVSYEKRYNSRLRNDFDPTSMASFYPSDEEDDSLDDDEPDHPFIAKDYSVPSDDLHDDHVSQHYPIIDLEEAEDFLEADDPALLDELEERFMFD